jgi:hypothetical protein
MPIRYIKYWYRFRLVGGVQGSNPWVFVVLGILAQVILVRFSSKEMEEAPMGKATCQFRVVFAALIGIARDIQINIAVGLLLPS